MRSYALFCSVHIHSYSARFPLRTRNILVFRFFHHLLTVKHAFLYKSLRKCNFESVLGADELNIEMKMCISNMLAQLAELIVYPVKSYLCVCLCVNHGGLKHRRTLTSHAY